jgi:hypothetical protein
MQALSSTLFNDLPQAMGEQGWAVLPAAEVSTGAGVALPALLALSPAWGELPADPHLRDGGHYRFRRHSCYVVDTGSGAATPVPHRAHWQSVNYNALHGGFERWFEPVLPEVAQAPAWTQLIGQLGRALAQIKPTPQWSVEAHQFRVDTTGGIGRPTPEGAHRDGVDFVVVIMVGRHQVKGGETRVFEAQGPHGVRFTLSEPWSALVLDDERVIHESTPIQPLQDHGWRDTLVLTYRAAGFQGPISTP